MLRPDLAGDLQNAVKGKMRAEESIAVKCDKDGAVYARWTGKAHGGRELIYKPGWNGGKVWIKEGGPLSFAAVAVGLAWRKVGDR